MTVKKVNKEKKINNGFDAENAVPGSVFEFNLDTYIVTDRCESGIRTVVDLKSGCELNFCNDNIGSYKWAKEAEAVVTYE